MIKAEGGYRWLLVGLLWFVWLLNYLDRQVIFSVFPLLQSELKLSSLELGLVSTAFLWVYALASPFAGYAADRFSRKGVIVSSVCVWSAITWATAHVRSLPELLFTRALMGISEALYLPAGLALIAAYHDKDTRSTATGIHYSGGYLGMVLGGFAGGWMGARYGWRIAFVALGILGLIYSLVIGLLIRDRRVDVTRVPASRRNLLCAIKELFALQGYPIMFIVFAVISIGNWMVYTWLPLYLYEKFGMNLAEAGFSATFYLQAGGVGGILFGGWLADRWSRTDEKARLRTQALGLAVAAPFLFLSGVTTSTVVLTSAMAVFGIGRGMYDCNCMPALCQIARDDLRSTGFGLFNFIGPFAGGIVAAAAGALKSTLGIGGALQVSGALLLLSAALLTRIKLPKTTGADSTM
jgi:MFS transporter, Spinster family, sphingosine-1-phosphate transporter